MTGGNPTTVVVQEIWVVDTYIRFEGDMQWRCISIRMSLETGIQQVRSAKRAFPAQVLRVRNIDTGEVIPGELIYD